MRQKEISYFAHGAPIVKMALAIFKMAIKDKAQFLSFVNRQRKPRQRFQHDIIIDNQFMLAPPRHLMPLLMELIKSFGVVAQKHKLLGKFTWEEQKSDGYQQGAYNRLDIRFKKKSASALSKDLKKVYDLYRKSQQSQHYTRKG